MPHVLFGVRIDDLTVAEFCDRVRQWLGMEERRVIFTPNAEVLLLARSNEIFRELLNQSDLSIPDSVSLCFAIAALTDGKLRSRIPGVDALQMIAQVCEQQHKRLVLLGGEHGVATQAAEALRRRHSILNVVGYDPGKIPFDGKRVLIEETVVEKLRTLAPDVVAVALGQGRQEFAIALLKGYLSGVKIWIAVGGALDMIAGSRPRAPQWLQRFGFEWLWRVAIEPRRWRRTMNAAVVFPLLVISSTLKSHRLLRALRRVARELVLQWKGL